MYIKETKKLLQGGGLPSYVSYVNVPLPIANPTTATNIPDNLTNPTIDDKMIKALYETGLTSDTAALVLHLDYYMTNLVNPFDTTKGLSRYKLLLLELAKLREGKRQLTEAVETAKSNDALSEMAITTDGRYYTLNDEGEILIKSSLELNDRYLTNADLAELRAEKIPNANNISTVISNGIGMSKVNKTIWDLISKIGSDSISTDFFRSKKGQEIKDGIDLLIAEGADGTYKVTLKNKDLTQKAQTALKYIISTLPANMKALLKGKAALRGMEPSEGAVLLVADMIASGLDSELTTSLQYDKLATNGADTDKDGNKQKVDIKPHMAYLQGKGGSPFKLLINPGLNHSMLVDAILYGLPLDNQGNPIPNGSLETVLKNTGFGAYTEIGNGIYVGNLKIDPLDYGRVYVSTDLMSRAWLPSVTESDGTIHPDYSLLDEYTEVEKQVRELGDRATKAQVESIIALSPMSEYYVDYLNGVVIWDYSKFRPFLMFNALAGGESNWFTKGFTGVINPDDLGGWGTNVKSMGRKLDEVKKMMESALNTKVEGNVYATIAYIPLMESSVLSMMAAKEYPIMTYGNPIAMNDIRLLQGQLQRLLQERLFKSASSSNLE